MLLRWEFGQLLDNLDHILGTIYAHCPLNVEHVPQVDDKVGRQDRDIALDLDEVHRWYGNGWPLGRSPRVDRRTVWSNR